MVAELRAGAAVLVGEHRVLFRVLAVGRTTFTVRSGNGPLTFPRRTRVEPIVARAAARALLARLVTPPASDVAPPTLPGADFAQRTARFAAAPLADQVALVRALLYTPTWYDLPSAEVIRRGADQVWDHLAAALDAAPRDVRRAVFRRDPAKLRQRGPVAVRDHEYVGAFALGTTAVVADRCHAAATRRGLALRVRAQPGAWHAWVRPDPALPGRNLALLAAHEDHLAARALAGPRLGAVGVDAGCVAILDARRLATDALFLARVTQAGFHWEDELVEGAGCYAMTHSGDGRYDVFAHRVDGCAVAFRVDLAADDDGA